MQGCIVEALHSKCAIWGIVWGGIAAAHCDFISLLMQLQVAEGQVPDTGYPGWILGFLVVCFGVVFLLTLKPYLQTRVDCNACKVSKSSASTRPASHPKEKQ